ncbi:uncharacterized protein [Fopius arisanus]|uniref:Uncharacterized protein n=1 Tax=Fopius arisanus TaxID=64838 RepID=A0A9R1T3U2_9HYME|nr:PREDICTED: uncharacterized protein LOC105265994 [Fopius arisanus]
MQVIIFYLRRIFYLPPKCHIAIFFHLLPYLIPSDRHTSGGRKRKFQNSLTSEQNSKIAQVTSVAQPPRRLSIQESRTSFFVHLQSAVDLEAILAAGKSHTAQHCLQHQPIPILIGPLTNVEASYVILEDVLYEVPSVIAACDVTLKICYAALCEYPPNSRSLWLFLQQAYFDIFEKKDKPATVLNALIGEIRSIIKENCHGGAS